jgi:Spy/CpxP family protein refolding chaperone
MRARLTALAATAALLLGLMAGPAAADPAPPTEGGNGAGQSGQCTGNPDDRPDPVCPA